MAQTTGGWLDRQADRYICVDDGCLEILPPFKQYFSATRTRVLIKGCAQWDPVNG